MKLFISIFTTAPSWWLWAPHLQAHRLPGPLIFIPWLLWSPHFPTLPPGSKCRSLFAATFPQGRVARIRSLFNCGLAPLIPAFYSFVRNGRWYRNSWRCWCTSSPTDGSGNFSRLSEFFAPLSRRCCPWNIRCFCGNNFDQSFCKINAFPECWFPTRYLQLRTLCDASHFVYRLMKYWRKGFPSLRRPWKNYRLWAF